jgi:hypothetical protein
LVDILTRKPCVFLRRRVLGWKVRLPFMLSLPSLSLSSLNQAARVRAAEFSILVQSIPKSQMPNPTEDRQFQIQALGWLWDLGFGFWDLRCYSRGLRSGVEDMDSSPTLRFLPQDFHTCGKNCGKAADPEQGAAKTMISWRLLQGESRRPATFRGSIGGRAPIRA